MATEQGSATAVKAAATKAAGVDPTVRALTDYLSDIQERSNLQDYGFSSAARFVEVPLEEVRSGALSAEAVATLFAQKVEAKPGGRSRRQDDAKSPAAPSPRASPIDLVISLVTQAGQRQKSGLLLLPAMLQPDGTLSADLESAAPWIPASRLSTPSIDAPDLTVGALADFWKYRRKKWPEAVSQIESWTDAVDAVLKMFAAVSDRELDAAAAQRDGEVIRHACFISTEKVITANGAILDLYAFVADRPAEVPAYEQLLSLAPRGRRDSDVIDDDLERLATHALVSCGSMSDGFALTPSQRRAVHAFLADRQSPDSAVTAVSGPPGTGKTTMLQSIVASTIVTHALEGRPAPLIVGTSTNNQAVTNIIDSFGSVTKDEPGPLDHRWLPAVDEEQKFDTPLSGLAAYCPSQGKAQQARAAGYLVEDTRKGGVYTAYSDPDYVAAATGFFLKSLGTYAVATGGVVAGADSVDGAIAGLTKALAKVDECRRILITEKAAAERALGRRHSDDIEQQIRSCARERERCQARLDFWVAREQEAAARPGRTPADDLFVIEAHHDPAEPSQRQPTLRGYVDFYRFHVQRWTTEIDRLADQQTQARHREAAAMAPSAATVHALDWLRRFGSVDDDSAATIAASTSLLDLDALLDTSVRYTQFWMAVHLYEAQWLKIAAGDELIPADHRRRTTASVMETYWRQAPALTPCFVMTAYQLPKYFRLFTRAAKPEFDLGRADLLIVDEAGQVDASVGAAAFATAKRAVVVGDVNQLAPVWSIDPESDREIAGLHGLGDHWPAMEAAGLTSSEPSSVMAAAANATRWSYGGGQFPGLFLSEHFRCHPAIINYCNDLLYKGMLEPRRPIEGYKLAGKTASPFLFCEVPGSQDSRSGSSRVNEPEAEAIAQWVVDNGDYFEAVYNADANAAVPVIGVVTPFAAQARLITRKLGELGGADLQKKITVGTAHRLQGAERPVVLFSSVYGNQSQQASFIDGTLPLMNVAVSRAKDLFIVFGGEARWKDRGPVFSLVHKYATRADCRFAADAVAYRTVARDEPGHVIGKDLVAQWNEAGLLLDGAQVTVRAVNAALERSGLIERTDAGPVPTAAGAAAGLAAYGGTGSDGPYVNLIYSGAAQDELTTMIRSGALDEES